MVGTADLKNQLYYYIYSLGDGPGILRAFDLHTLAANGSKTLQGMLESMQRPDLRMDHLIDGFTGDVPSDMFWDSEFGLLGFWMSPVRNIEINIPPDTITSCQQAFLLFLVSSYLL